MIECQLSKTGVDIYLYNGKSLASRNDPYKEANDWLEQSKAVVRGAKAAIVLGAGCGFHINALRQSFPNLPIFVFDPRADLIARIQDRFGMSLMAIEFFDKIEQLPDKVLSQCFVSLRHIPSWVGLESQFLEIENFLSGRMGEGFDHLLSLRPEFTAAKKLASVGASAMSIKDFIARLDLKNLEPVVLGRLRVMEELLK